MGPTDLELVARVIARDDRHAFAELLRRNQSSVRALLRRLTCGNDAHADDLAQEVFLRAYRGLPGFRGGAQFSSWLYRIATNVFLSDAARTAPRPDPGVLDPPSAASSHMAFLRHDLDRALARLAPEERLAVVLSYEVGASHEEIATFLGCPLGTAKSHVQRGRQRLSAYLGAWNEEGPHVVTP